MTNRPSNTRMFCWARLVSASAVAVLLLPGCGSVLTRGQVITQHMHGQGEEPDRAPSDGEYSLYSKFGDGTAYHTASLRAGDYLGFRTSRTGQIEAIAGDDNWTMTDGDYVWKRN